MSSSAVVCANPGCGEPGKLKCTGCAAVSYCSPNCQKKHWPTHKATCKTSKAGQTADATEVKPQAPAPVMAQTIAATAPTSEVEARFNAIQTETQRLFQTGDFAASIKSGLTALELTKELPPQVANTEAVQIHLNCSSAYMQMQKFPEALEHSELAVKEAENGIKLRPGQPQAIEVLAITYGAKAFALLNNQKVEEANVAAERSLALAESIYPKGADPRLYKPLRTLATVRERQGNFEEAEKLMFRSYMSLALTIGPQTTEAQMSIDELCNFLLKRNELTNAEKFARLNYKAINDKKQQGQLDERGELILGDSASRVAQILRRMERFAEAEELMQQALTIREERLGKNNPLGVAYTLVQLASIQESQGKIGEDVDAKLMRALDIFGRVKGQTCPEVQNTMNQLLTVRSKRARAAGGAAPAAAGEDGLEYTVSGEKGRLSSGTRNPTAAGADSTGANRGPGAVTAPRGPAPSSGLTDDEELARHTFGADDGMARLMAANTFFEQGRFGAAEVVLAQAYEILLRQKGPNDQLTMAARQNLGVARNNGLNRLWMQVVQELVADQEKKLAASASTNNLKGDSAGQTASEKLSEQDKVVSEYAALMAGQKSGKAPADPMEAMLFSDESRSKGGCTIC